MAVTQSDIARTLRPYTLHAQQVMAQARADVERLPAVLVLVQRALEHAGLPDTFRLLPDLVAPRSGPRRWITDGPCTHVTVRDQLGTPAGGRFAEMIDDAEMILCTYYHSREHWPAELRPAGGDLSAHEKEREAHGDQHP